jgi:hypothetical protein
MTFINRKMLLDTMIQHETLTIIDLAKKANLGFIPITGQLNYLLQQLRNDGLILLLRGAIPATFTITDKGIQEGKRLNEIAMN